MSCEPWGLEPPCRLGALHVRGIAVKRDYTKAYYNFNLAAHQGHVVATYNLAMMQLAGRARRTGLPKGFTDSRKRSMRRHRLEKALDAPSSTRESVAETSNSTN